MCQLLFMFVNVWADIFTVKTYGLFKINQTMNVMTFKHDSICEQHTHNFLITFLSHALEWLHIFNSKFLVLFSFVSVGTDDHKVWTVQNGLDHLIHTIDIHITWCSLCLR